jgi:lipopolysaccharide heptosyltransferase II
VSPSTPFEAEAVRPKQILICGLNWLGDAILAMPALQVLSFHHADAELTLLTKPELAPLWEMHQSPARILTLPNKGRSLRPTLQALRELDIATAYVLPHSFRSALPPFLAGIPNRIGLPGHFPRDVMLTEVRRAWGGAGRTHQVYEMLDLFFPDQHRRAFAPPKLTVPTEGRETMKATLASLPQPWITVIPGAARGPSKQWPAERYAETAAQLVAQTGGSIITLGTKKEQAACQQVAAASAPNGLNLAGETTMQELAAVLSLSSLSLCNDSGGMHLAAALGTPVVALFGITDPDSTGPLGPHIRILQHAVRRSRDVPRRSAEAEKALASISTTEVIQASLQLLHPA